VWNFLAVVGASGSGKSSIVRTGLLPQLSKSEQWKIFPPFTPAWQSPPKNVLLYHPTLLPTIVAFWGRQEKHFGGLHVWIYS